MSANSEEQRFIWSDAWILTSIILATQRVSPATLTGIIAAADYINHAILTRGELETGLTRLVDADYVTHDSHGFSLTDKVRSWTATGSHTQTMPDLSDSVAEFIGAPLWNAGPLPEAFTEHYISEADYKAAVQQYYAMMRKLAKRKG